MEKRFISNFAGARLVDCTPLIPRESSVSKETGQAGCSETVSLRFEEFQGCARTHGLYPTDGIDRSIHGGTFQLSAGSKGKQRSDLGYRGWDRVLFPFPFPFLSRVARGERGVGEREGRISARVSVRVVRSRAIVEKVRGGIESETRGDVSRGEISPYAIKASASTRTAAYINRCVAR